MSTAPFVNSMTHERRSIVKKFLIFSIFAVLLALPVISLASGGVGVGVAPSITLQAYSLNNASSFSDSTTVMQIQKFILKNGVLSFSVNDVNYSDKTAGMTFKGQLQFAGGATYGKTTLGNLFMNLSGLMLRPTKTGLTAMALVRNGTLNGTADVTDVDSNGNPTTNTVSFSGSYAMNAALKLVNNQVVSGSIAPSMIISGLNIPVVTQNPVTLANTTTMQPAPVIMRATFAPIAFTVPTNGAGGGNGTINLSGVMNPVWVTSDLTCGGASTFNLAQTGNVLSGTKYDNQSNNCSDPTVYPVTGTVSASSFVMQFTGGNNGGTITVSGTLNADHTLSGVAKNSKGVIVAKWGAAEPGYTPGGVTGTWSVAVSSHSLGTSSDTVSLYQFGSTVLGSETGDQSGVIGSAASTTLTFSFLDGQGGKVNVKGAIPSGTLVSGSTISGTYTDVLGGKTVDYGTFVATMQ